MNMNKLVQSEVTTLSMQWVQVIY